MFTEEAQCILDRAKDCACSAAATEMGVDAFMAAMAFHAEAVVLLAECFAVPADKIRAIAAKRPEPVACPGKMRVLDRLPPPMRQSDAEQNVEPGVIARYAHNGGTIPIAGIRAE